MQCEVVTVSLALPSVLPLSLLPASWNHGLRQSVTLARCSVPPDFIALLTSVAIDTSRTSGEGCENAIDCDVFDTLCNLPRGHMSPNRASLCLLTTIWTTKDNHRIPLG